MFTTSCTGIHWTFPPWPNAIHIFFKTKPVDFMTDIAIPITSVSFSLIIKVLLPFIAARRACTKIRESASSCVLGVLNHQTQLRDCNRRLFPLSQWSSTACLFWTTAGTQENWTVRSCCCYLSESLSNFGESLTGWYNPSSYPFAPFGSFLYFQTWLLIHINHNLNSLVLGRIWSNSWRDVVIGVVNNKHLMTSPKEKSEFCFPKTLNVLRGEA